MPGGLYLTPDELKALTDYRTRAAVIRWLERNNWPYADGARDGWPRVLRSYHDARLSGEAPIKRASTYEPNWSTAG
ncbi:DUF4224 domain-containing protein [Pigmentiphaga daeguensis]|uniref:DUF4224 domain-containing protein n=1 Tax=Pigmentiphaga daeguensis TaxID=414049 RepID=A0ABN1B8H6_9BURK